MKELHHAKSFRGQVSVSPQVKIETKLAALWGLVVLKDEIQLVSNNKSLAVSVKFVSNMSS